MPSHLPSPLPDELPATSAEDESGTTEDGGPRSDLKSRDWCVGMVLTRLMISEAGLTLNREKCELN